jgi:dihydropteroate synthase
VNDVWGVAADDALSRLAASRGVPFVLMHNRAEARCTTSSAESSLTSRPRSIGR